MQRPHPLCMLSFSIFFCATAAGAQPARDVSSGAYDDLMVAALVREGDEYAKIGTGLAFAVLSNQTASEADTLRQSVEKDAGPNACTIPGQFAAQCDQLRALGKELSGHANAATWLLIAGVTAGAGTLVYTLVTQKKSPPAAVQVVPVVHAGSTAVIVRGQW